MGNTANTGRTAASRATFLMEVDPRNLPQGIFVGAIDFGASRSVYGWSIVGANEVHHGVPEKSLEPGADDPKCESCFAISITGARYSVVAVGKPARKQYIENPPPGICLFESFKMTLLTIRESKKFVSVKDHAGGEHNADDVLVAVLEHFSTQCILNFTNIHRSGAQLNNCHWVLTVPVKWPIGARDRMKKAAHRAGLIATEHSNNITIIDEPEAALYDFAHEMEDEHGDHHCVPFQVGDILLLCDNGGGTNDNALVEIVELNPFRYNVLHTNGSDVGAARIDREFLRFMGDLLGKENLRAIFRHESMLSLQDQWMERKHGYESESVELDVTDVVTELKRRLHLSKSEEEILKEKVDAYNKGQPSNSQVRGKNQLLTIPKTIVKSWFDSNNEKIFECMTGAINHVAPLKPSYCVVVGGYSGNLCFQSALAAYCASNQIRLLHTKQPHLAIVRGAVRAGMLPTRISPVVARPAPRTYGIRLAKVFDWKEDFFRLMQSTRLDDGRRILKERCLIFCCEGTALPHNQLTDTYDVYPADMETDRGIMELYEYTGTNVRPGDFKRLRNSKLIARINIFIDTEVARTMEDRRIQVSLRLSHNRCPDFILKNNNGEDWPWRSRVDIIDEPSGTEVSNS